MMSPPQTDQTVDERLRILVEVRTTILTPVRVRELYRRLLTLGLTEVEIEEFTPELLPGHAAAAQYA